MTECIRLEAKFSDGFDLYEQCQQMKKEAMAAALKRSLPPAPFPQYQKPRDPLAHCWEQEWRRATPPWDAPGTGTARAKAEGRVPETCRERQGATSSCRNSSQKSAAKKSSSCASCWSARAETATWTPTGQNARACRTAAGVPKRQSARAYGPPAGAEAPWQNEVRRSRACG